MALPDSAARTDRSNAATAACRQRNVNTTAQAGSAKALACRPHGAAWRSDWQLSGRTLLVGASEDGSLYIEQGNGERTALLPVSERTFRRAGDGEATSGFYEADGALFFEADNNWVKAIDATSDAAYPAPVGRASA